MSTSNRKLKGLAWHPGERFYAVLTNCEVLVYTLRPESSENVCVWNWPFPSARVHSIIEMEIPENEWLTFNPDGTQLQISFGTTLTLFLMLTDTPAYHRGTCDRWAAATSAAAFLTSV